jgi:hypothetical protein
MPSIADLYSTIDSYKRRAADVLSDPQNSLMQMLGYANDRARQYNESLAQASKERGYGPKTQELAQAMAESYNPVGMTTWHGSPHTFNKFDMSKIGTGEGAQAYGHGLYLAENPEVAETYKSAVDFAARSAFMHLQKNNGDLKQTIKEVTKDVKNYEQNQEFLMPGVLDQTKQKLDYLKAQQSGKPINIGNLYKVDLPDEHIAKMLDWDKPLSEQHPDVKKAMKGIAKEFPEIPDFNLQKWMDTDPLASTWHNVINRDLGVEQSKIADVLANKGIPGIKYFDQQSRNPSEGTRNFVIFDPNIAKIEERNSVPIPQDPHAPNYLEDVHKALAQKPIDVTDVHAPNYLEDIHNQLANQQ